MTIVVNSVNRVRRRRLRAHIFNKRIKINPPVAHLYSATSVVRVGSVALVVAPVDHADPRSVKRVLSFSKIGHQLISSELVTPREVQLAGAPQFYRRLTAYSTYWAARTKNG